MKKLIFIIVILCSLYCQDEYIKLNINQTFKVPSNGYFVKNSFLDILVHKSENYDILKTNESAYNIKIINRDNKIQLLEQKINLLDIDNSFLKSQNDFLTNQLITFKTELIDKPRIRFDIGAKSIMVVASISTSFILGWVLNSKYN